MVVAGLVIAGMAWATDIALTLERSRTEDEFQTEYSRKLRRARQRIDSRILSMLSDEEGYSPYEYRLKFRPSKLFRGFYRIDTSEMWEASPFVTEGSEEWLILHFQATSIGEWSSPEAEVREIAWIPDIEVDYDRTSEANTYLNALRNTLKPEKLGDLWYQAQARDIINNRWDGGVNQAQAEYVRQCREFEQALRERRVPESCDPHEVALLNLFNLAAPDSEAADRDDEAIESPAPHPPLAGGSRDFGDVEVDPSPLSPIWIRLPEKEEPLLAYVRSVTVGQEKLFQGFLIDWPMLREELLAAIDDELPNASIVPLESGPVQDFDTLLTKVPATIETGIDPVQATTVGWTTMSTGLLLAWIAAITVLAAVALGIKSLIALAERRRQFAYAVSHELRTPLTTFRLYTDMLAGGLVPPEKQPQYLQTLNHESERLSQLVSGVLEYSRIEHQSVSLAMSETTVGEMLSLASQRFDAHCKESDRQLVLQPNGVTDVSCRTDVDLTLQILGTLIDNACKYAAEAEDRRIILSAGNGQPGVIHIDVADFGPGINRRERRRIFKPFRRGKNCATNSAGIGLGLALASRWARLLGGDLRLNPAREHPQGASFRLTVPISPSA
jgi:signal transduction histidine kinase